MYAIVDIETTGGNAFTDKITEIAIYVHNGEQVTDHFTTLINPGRSIPPFVQNLTGITDEMVADAPCFSDVAEQIRKLTEPFIFVAHSSQFDYSFIQQEFRDIGFEFRRPTLCTVSFSRKVLPGYRTYGLGALCERLSINNEQRHRAVGDAFATVQLFEHLLGRGGKDLIEQFIKQPVEEKVALPTCIRPEIMGMLPSRPGIFYLLNNRDEIIYIGKGSNIRKGVITLLTKTRNKKCLRLREEVHDVRFEPTGNELMAGIMEYYEWKKYQPSFNRRHLKPFHSGMRSSLLNGYAVFRGRSEGEESIIRVVNGTVSGFAYLSQECQLDPESIMVSLPSDNYINFLLHKAILKRHALKVINL